MKDRAERSTLALLALSTAFAIGFIVAYVLGASTQWLGIGIGGSLCLLAAALIVIGRGVVPQEQTVEERPEIKPDPEQEDALEDDLAHAGDGVSRRKLIVGGLGAAGTALAAATVVPAASLGPNPGEEIGSSPWRRGIPVVNTEGDQLQPGDINIGAFVTGFPDGADRRDLGSPIVLVKLEPDELDLPEDRRLWAPEGVLAFSKICTHAACAINLYRHPLYEPTSPGPALVCPCHYSTFDPAQGGKRIFGPAGRPLPQLPLAIDSGGKLIADGDFSESVGPSWSNVDRGDL